MSSESVGSVLGVNVLLVNVAELLRRPGTDKDLEVALTAEEIGITDPRVAPTDQVDVAVKLESLTDGVVVTGRLATPWHDICKRCLVPIEGVETVPVDELYQTHVTSDEAFPIVFDQIDLTDMVRELVLLDLPAAPLCRDDCAGLCPTCGVNHNEQSCTCERVEGDLRWSALDALREQLN